MTNEFTPIATRMENARTRFVEAVVEQFGFDDDEAAKIYEVFVEVKAIKVDVAVGQFKLQNGAFWAKDVMANALAM